MTSLSLMLTQIGETIMANHNYELAFRCHECAQNNLDRFGTYEIPKEPNLDWEAQDIFNATEEALFGPVGARTRSHCDFFEFAEAISEQGYGYWPRQKLCVYLSSSIFHTEYYNDREHLHLLDDDEVYIPAGYMKLSIKQTKRIARDVILGMIDDHRVAMLPQEWREV